MIQFPHLFCVSITAEGILTRLIHFEKGSFNIFFSFQLKLYVNHYVFICLQIFHISMNHMYCWPWSTSKNYIFSDWFLDKFRYMFWLLCQTVSLSTLLKTNHDYYYRWLIIFTIPVLEALIQTLYRFLTMELIPYTRTGGSKNLLYRSISKRDTCLAHRCNGLCTLVNYPRNFYCILSISLLIDTRH